MRASRVFVATATAILGCAATAHAQLPTGQIGDQLALGKGEGQEVPQAPVQKNAEPPLTPVPAAQCPAGPHTQPGIDGRVPAGSDQDGLYCHASLVGHQGTSGGFKTLRYVDDNGHVCAFYDTALLFPLNAFKLDSSSIGVAVLDMSDPAKPVQTATLVTPPMMSPHESLLVSQKSGLLASVLGNPTTHPGDVDIYDVRADCRHPVLDFESVIARLGHESGFSPDGRTFYATGTARQSITAIDVSDPKNPFDVWQGQVLSHGMSISDDGNRAYVADSSAGQMAILDTSEIQARKPDPQVHEVARMTWDSASIPQNAMPFSEDGHPYILEFDEYSKGLAVDGPVGAARIIDIADEHHPTVVSNLRLAIDQQPARANAADDPGMGNMLQGYAAHYCNIPSRVDPKIVACSFIASGLRVFDISDLRSPKEAAYFVAPNKPATENGEDGSNFAMSQPAFDLARHDVWYTDGTSGFYVVHIADDAWPAGGGHSAAAGRTCGSRRAFAVHVRAPRGTAIRRVRATVGGKAIRATAHGRTARALVRLTGRPRRVVHVVVRVTLRGGRVITSRRTYHPCQARA